MLGSGWFVSHCAIAIRGHGGWHKFNQWVCDLGVVVRLVLLMANCVKKNLSVGNGWSARVWVVVVAYRLII